MIPIIFVLQGNGLNTQCMKKILKPAEKWVQMNLQ